MKLAELNVRFESLIKNAMALSKEDYAKFMANIEMLKLKYQTPKHQNRHPDLNENDDLTFKTFIDL
jgi:hypothetical protein